MSMHRKVLEELTKSDAVTDVRRLVTVIREDYRVVEARLSQRLPRLIDPGDQLADPVFCSSSRPDRRDADAFLTDLGVARSSIAMDRAFSDRGAAKPHAAIRTGQPEAYKRTTPTSK